VDPVLGFAPFVCTWRASGGASRCEEPFFRAWNPAIRSNLSSRFA